MPLLGRHRPHPRPAMPASMSTSGISEEEYSFIRDLVYRSSRINLGENKKELVTARLGKRLRSTGIPTIAAYIEHIRGNAGAEERMHLIDAISTNHTFFMREMEHFQHL
jgi:chemotaxis protein methyltransferase CheR